MGVFLQGVGFWFFDGSINWSILFTVVTVVVISYGFELYSKITGKGHHEVLDAIASIIGGLLGMGLTLTWQLLLF